MKIDEHISYLIKNGFSELARCSIQASYAKMADVYAEFGRSHRTEYTLVLSQSLKKAPTGVVRGCIAHELSHIVKETKMSNFLSSMEGRLYDSLPTYQTWDERNTDLDVVRRGYGKELLAFVEYANKRRKKYTKSDGITAKELKTLLSEL